MASDSGVQKSSRCALDEVLTGGILLGDHGAAPMIRPGATRRFASAAVDIAASDHVCDLFSDLWRNLDRLDRVTEQPAQTFLADAGVLYAWPIGLLGLFVLSLPDYT